MVCLQETKLQPHQIELELPGYHQYWNSAEKKGYSGTAVFTRKEPLSVTYGIGMPEHDTEGGSSPPSIEGFLPGVLLYPQRPAGADPPCLPTAWVGGRLPRLSEGIGRAKAGHPLGT